MPRYGSDALLHPQLLPYLQDTLSSCRRKIGLTYFVLEKLALLLSISILSSQVPANNLIICGFLGIELYLSSM